MGAAEQAERPPAVCVHGMTDAIFLSTGAREMPQHPAAGSPAGEDLLREIARREQELQQRLAEARAEAARSIERAQQEAEVIRAGARDQARQAAQVAAAATDQEAQKISREILARAEAEAQTIRRRAEERRPLAADFVTNEVLGTSGSRGGSA
jgi:vacuolar-type H+-ATPase subunit H